jgi:hypothetical protein
MDQTQLIKVLENYEEVLTKRGLVGLHRLNGGDTIDHVVWMVTEAKGYAKEGRVEKANRWLGFIQGVLWSKGIFKIDEMKEHNRKPKRQFDKDELAREAREWDEGIRTPKGWVDAPESIPTVSSGLVCSWCHVRFTKSHGYPVLCKPCWRQAQEGDMPAGATLDGLKETSYDEQSTEA